MAEPRLHHGRWEVSAYDETGRRVWYRADTKAEARAWAAAMSAERSTGRVIVPRDTEWAELEALWYVDRADKLTLSDDRQRIEKWLRPHLRHCRLEDIGPARVERLRADLAEHGLSIQTQRHVLGLLRSMLRLALRERLISREIHVRLPRQTEQPYEWIRTREGIERLLQAAGEYSTAKVPDGYPGLPELYGCAVRTGMRIGEVCGLQWAAVDFARGLIEVRRSWDREHTKSGRIRHAPISPKLRADLLQWRDRRSELYPDSPHDNVFLNTSGRPIVKASRPVSQIWREVVRDADLPPMGIHALRHTFASHWVMAGKDIFELNRILGHSDMKLTMRYAHLEPKRYDHLDF